MAQFKVGQTVTVISQGRDRRIVQIMGDRALCKAFTTGQEDWFPLTGLRPADNRPLRYHIL